MAVDIHKPGDRRNQAEATERAAKEGGERERKRERTPVSE